MKPSDRSQLSHGLGLAQFRLSSYSTDIWMRIGNLTTELHVLNNKINLSEIISLIREESKSI